MNNRLAELFVSAILVVGIVGILIRDGYLLFEFSIPVGTDGFYYLNQVQSIRSTGELCYPTATPLLLYMFGLLSRASLDPLLTIKAGALFLLGALLIAAGRFVTILTGSRSSGLVTAALILASNSHLYFIVEFLNNLAALSLLILGVGSLLKGRVLAGSILSALAAPTHSSVPLIVSSAIVFALIATFCLSFASAATVKRTNAARIFVLASSMATCAIALNPLLDRTTGLESIGGRVSLLTHLQTGMALPVILFVFGLRQWISVSTCLGVFLAISLMNLGKPLPAGISPLVLTRRLHLMNTLRNWPLPPDSLVIAAHGDQFLVSNVLRVTSTSRLAPAKDKAKVWWLLRGPQTALESLARLTHSSRRSSDYVMVEDSKLRPAFGNLSSKDQFVVLAANPHLRRELNQALDSELDRLRYQ